MTWWKWWQRDTPEPWSPPPAPEPPPTIPRVREFYRDWEAVFANGERVTFAAIDWMRYHRHEELEVMDTTGRTHYLRRAIYISKGPPRFAVWCGGGEYLCSGLLGVPCDSPTHPRLPLTDSRSEGK